MKTELKHFDITSAFSFSVEASLHFLASESEWCFLTDFSVDIIPEQFRVLLDVCSCFMLMFHYVMSGRLPDFVSD